MLNATQLNFFKNLVFEAKENNVDLEKISEIKTLQYFGFWKKALNSLSDQKIINEEGKTLSQTIDSHIQDLLIDYSNHHQTRFDSKYVLSMFQNFFNYIQYERDVLYYFSPIYNFEFNDDELNIDDFVTIRKISDAERNYLSKYYEKFSPVKVSINKIKFVFIVAIPADVSDSSSLAEEKIYQVLNKFKILNEGDIRSGGLYNFDKSHNWNPQNKFDRIQIEPVGIFSKKKYILHKRHTKKFQELFLKISHQYPDLTSCKLEIYDVFDRSIRRFSESLDKENKSEKIVDLVLCLEILLVSAPYESTLKISQRTALLIGKNLREKLEISKHMISFYSFRSGQVHEFKDRPLKVDTPVTKDYVLKKLESWTRRSLLQMFYLSQERKNSKLTFRELLKKIDESMYDQKLSSEFTKISNQILKQSKF